MEQKHSVLLVEDDKELRNLMTSYLTQRGYAIDTVDNGRDGLAKALSGKNDLVILDIMLPHLSGMEALKQLRRRSRIPVIVLTALGSPEARIAGLQAGADDYLCKPFAPEELLERIRAVLRRSGHSIPLQSTIVEVRGIKLNSATREVEREGVRVSLTAAEFDLLDVLMRSAGRVVSRDEIASMLYQRETTPYERVLDVHVSHLRKKIERPGEPLITGVRGVGYMFKAEA